MYYLYWRVAFRVAVLFRPSHVHCTDEHFSRVVRISTQAAPGLFSKESVWVKHGLASFLAIALKPVMAAIASLNKQVEEAALVDGATIVERLFYVVLPLVLPSVVAGGVMVFLLAFNELTISVLLWSAGTETLGVALLNLEEAGLGAEAVALAIVATLVIAFIMISLECLGRYFPEHSLPWRVLGR